MTFFDIFTKYGAVIGLAFGEDVDVAAFAGVARLGIDALKFDKDVFLGNVIVNVGCINGTGVGHAFAFVDVLTIVATVAGFVVFFAVAIVSVDVTSWTFANGGNFCNTVSIIGALIRLGGAVVSVIALFIVTIVAVEIVVSGTSSATT